MRRDRRRLDAMTRLTLVLTAVLAVPPPVAAQAFDALLERARAGDRLREAAGTAESFERFRLFAYCAPVYLAVAVQDDGDDLSDLTEERVRTMAESRLRAARLYALPNTRNVFSGILVVTVNINGRAVVTDFKYQKLVSDPVTATAGLMYSEVGGTFGTHGGDSNFVMQGVSEHLDAFIGDYLRRERGDVRELNLC